MVVAPPCCDYGPAHFRLEEEWEERNRERLIRVVVDANRLAQEANMLADALHKDTVFKVTLTVSGAGHFNWSASK